MPSKKPPAKVEIDHLDFLFPDHVDRAGLIRFLEDRYSRARVSGFAGRGARLAIFDPANRDLSKLAIGLLEGKAITLPRKFLPKTVEDLEQLCRQLIDRGEDAAHVNLIFEGWPEHYSLKQHVASLWRIKTENRLLFEDLVRGRIGRALCRIGRGKAVGMPRDQILLVVAVQCLLWCAMDVQMVAARGHASNTAPLGDLLSVTLGEENAATVIKSATVLREMREGLDELEPLLAEYRTAPQRKPGEVYETDVETPRAKVIGHQAEKRRGAHKTDEEWQRELDDSIPAIQVAIPLIRDRIAELEALGVADGESNKHRSFFAVWNSGLTPVDGLAVALIRYVQAERLLLSLVDRLLKRACARPSPIAVDPLPALPEQCSDEWKSIKRRVFDLLDSARRVHLDDENWRSRDKVTRDLINSGVREDASFGRRQSHERGGWTNINKAEEFLRAMGQRRRDALSPRHSHDHRHRTYCNLDVVPELRIFV